ncbi:hypothetical protein B0H14DRAFT_2557016 [Mycena olivaceomarginata]|nr:hypothetical protein B0H14DRAFT_2557016 [Mycena olivaceomarginata]
MHEEIFAFSVAPGAHRTSTRRAETIYVGSWRELARATAEKIDKAHYIAQGTGGYERSPRRKSQAYLDRRLVKVVQRGSYRRLAITHKAFSVAAAEVVRELDKQSRLLTDANGTWLEMHLGWIGEEVDEHLSERQRAVK